MNATNIVRATVLAACLVALNAPAVAQQAVQRAAETPSVRSLERQRPQAQQQAPASSVEQVQLNPQPLPPTPPDPTRQVTPPVGGAGSATLPDNLFQLNDRAIIVVGGRQMQVGQVKREISAELERLSGPPVTARSVVRPQRDATTSVTGASSNMTGTRSPSTQPRVNVPVTAGPAGATTRPAGATTRPGSSVTQTTVTARDAIEYCTKNPARVRRVDGPLRPQQAFTIHGECFGERAGRVEVSGLPGRLNVREWSNHRIVAVMPFVRGHADKQLGVTIVRADQGRSAPAQADFVAVRQRVEVPANKWAPNGNLKRQFAQTETGGTFLEAGIGSAGETFRLAVNPACALTEASWTQRVGRVTAFEGWEQGPAHAADVSIRWAPLCVTSKTSFIFPLSTTQICEIAFDLHAWAQCPLGVAP